MCELLIHEAVCYLLLFSTVIEDNEIVYRDYVDISVAVATPKVCNVAFTLITLMRPFDGLRIHCNTILLLGLSRGNARG